MKHSIRHKCKKAGVTPDDLVNFIIDKMKDGHSLNWCCGYAPIKLSPDERVYLRHNIIKIDEIVKEQERTRYDGFTKTYLRKIGAIE